MKYVFGIDVGGTTVKIGLFSQDGTMIRKWEIFTNKEDDGKHIIEEIHKSIVDEGINLDDVLGYGFGVPGPVVNNHIIQCVNLGWKYYDLVGEFSRLVSNDNIVVQNDANVAALGESFKGAAAGKEDIVMITLGTGVGGGIISNSSPVEGAFGGGGEIGHMMVRKSNGRKCNCGSTGCLETIASATGIKKEYVEMAKELNLEAPLNKTGRVSAKAVFKAAKNGDKLSIAVIDRVSYYLAYACHVISVITNPEVIVIGGGVSKAGDFLLSRIQKEFKEYKFIAAQTTQIKLAKLGNDAGMYGAASLIING